MYIEGICPITDKYYNFCDKFQENLLIGKFIDR
jgi:hypothetical protein